MRPRPDFFRRPAAHHLVVLAGLFALAVSSLASALDRTGKVQNGVASHYGPGFAGKKTASGKPMNPNHMTAASRTLPLGTKAKVANRDNGRSAHVTVTDRGGPYAKGRVIDVSPKAAEQLEADGVAPVKVKPVEPPPEKPQRQGHASPPQARPPAGFAGWRRSRPVAANSPGGRDGSLGGIGAALDGRPGDDRGPAPGARARRAARPSHARRRQ